MKSATGRGADLVSDVDTIIEAEAWGGIGADWTSIAARCHQAARFEDNALAGSAAILFTDDARVQRLNKQFRNVDRATNVLSFPVDSQEDGFMGDIALAFETCQREAEQSGIRMEHHVAHLIVHGLLHLVGYDHETDEDAQRMEALEVKILAAMGVSDPYEAA